MEKVNMERKRVHAAHVGGRGFLGRLCMQKTLIAMALPGVAVVLIFNYIPMYGITIAFQNFNPVKGFFNTDIEWVGFKYFLRFFDSPYAFRLLRNTLLLGVYSLIFSFPLPIILAILLDQLRVKRFKKVVQTISYMPFFSPPSSSSELSRNCSPITAS